MVEGEGSPNSIRQLLCEDKWQQKWKPGRLWAAAEEGLSSVTKTTKITLGHYKSVQ